MKILEMEQKYDNFNQNGKNDQNSEIKQLELFTINIEAKIQRTNERMTERKCYFNSIQFNGRMQ